MIWEKKFLKRSHYFEIKIQSLIKKVNSMNRFQKFLGVVDGHEETDFFVFWLFWLRPFFGPFFGPFFKISWIKNDWSQKSYFNEKSVFFMHVNHVKIFLNFVHAVALFSWLFPENFYFYVKIMAPFFKKKFLLKSLVMVGTLTGLMCSGIQESWSYSSIHVVYMFENDEKCNFPNNSNKS